MKFAADEFLFVIVTVISVAPSPSGGLFATGSGDMRARIWRLVLLVFTSPRDFLSFSPPSLIGLSYFCLPLFLIFSFFFSPYFTPQNLGDSGPVPPRFVFPHFGVA